MQAEKKRAQLGARGVAEAATARSLCTTHGVETPPLDILILCSAKWPTLSGEGDVVENKTRLPMAKRKWLKY